MLSCPECANKAIPREYRAAAEALFPPAGYPAGKGPSLKAVKTFAKILGIGVDYKRCLDFRAASGGLGNLWGHFQNNLDLLIQKTWVEKADEIRKENLLDRLPAFIAGIEREDYQQALEEYGGVLEELAYLFFGAQSRQDDFAEYTFRIDTQMGLFWWYGAQLCSLRTRKWMQSADKRVLLAILLLGICYLTNF